MALFYRREQRVSQPLIDFSLFGNLNFAAGNATGLLLSAAMMGAFFTIPIFLQSVLGYSAVKAGLVMAPMSVVIIFAAPLAGALSDRLGSRWIVAAGMFLLAFGLAWMAGLVPGVARISPATTPASLLVPFVLSGVGVGLAVAPVTSAVMATAPRDRVGNASGVLSTMRQIGSLMGIAVLGAVLQNRVTANVTRRRARRARPARRAQAGDRARRGGRRPADGRAQGAAHLPAAAQAAIAQLFRSWFTSAVAGTFVVAVGLAVAGGRAPSCCAATSPVWTTPKRPPKFRFQSRNRRLWLEWAASAGRSRLNRRELLALPPSRRGGTRWQTSKRAPR